MKLNITDEQRQELSNALVRAFPKPESLEMMVSYKLGESLDLITRDRANYRTRVFDLGTVTE
jgi:hypothetical protein